MSYELKVDPKKRAGSRFIGKVRRELVSALLDEKAASGVTQQKLATALGVHRSVISRMLKGETNLTLRSLGEIAWAMGWEPHFTMKRKSAAVVSNRQLPVHAASAAVSSGTSGQNIAVYAKSPLTKSSRALEAAE